MALCGYVFTLARYEFQTVTLPKASLPRDFQLLLAKCLTVNKKLYPYAIIAAARPCPAICQAMQIGEDFQT